VTALTTTAAASVVLSSQLAHAAPADESIKSAKAKVDALWEQAEAATEKYDGVNEEKLKLQQQVAAFQSQVARGQEDLNRLRDQLGMVATAQYRSGGIDPSLQLFLSSDPDSYLDKASALDRLSTRQTGILAQLVAKKQTLDQQKAEATGKLQALNATTAQLAQQKATVKAKLQDAQRLYNSLTSAQKAAIAADKARADRSNNRVVLGNAPAASQRAAAALAAAKTRIGLPYVWGATGPGSFDCSGLTSWAYAQAGVSIPRTSRAQAGAGTHLALSQLQPGDLVVFYSDLHHIGLYAGNGMVLHAPRTGETVKYEPISDMPFEFGVRV
jgi:cell wall-associated NlpC family hydrolase